MTGISLEINYIFSNIFFAIVDIFLMSTLGMYVYLTHPNSVILLLSSAVLLKYTRSRRREAQPLLRSLPTKAVQGASYWI